MCRSDLYQKAAQMRILHHPGSRLEDRQYDIKITNISMATGNWNDIIKYTNRDTTVIYVYNHDSVIRNLI